LEPCNEKECPFIGELQELGKLKIQVDTIYKLLLFLCTIFTGGFFIVLKVAISIIFKLKGVEL